MKSERIIIALIVGAAIVGYALVNRQTALYRMKAERSQQSVDQIAEDAKEQERQRALAKCLLGAENNFNSQWNNNCEMLSRKEGCSLPLYLADRIEKNRQDDQDKCVSLWGK